MKLDALSAAHPQWRKSVLVLEPPELPLNRRAAAIERPEQIR